MLSGKKLIRSAAVLSAVTIMLTACTGRKQKAACALSDALRSDYVSDISFTVGTDNGEYSGKATVTKSGYTTRIDIHSPDPYSGLSAEYNVRGLPDSVAVHFSGMDATLPKDALAKINPLTSLFADDFASELSKLPSESIKEYDSDDTSALCASVTYNGADITLYFASGAAVPKSLEYTSDTMSADITFDTFRAEVTELS